MIGNAKEREGLYAQNQRREKLFRLFLVEFKRKSNRFRCFNLDMDIESFHLSVFCIPSYVLQIFQNSDVKDLHLQKISCFFPS